MLGKILFVILHSFFMLRTVWFIRVTDRTYTNHLRKQDPERYKIISVSWHGLIMHYQRRRIEVLEDEFFGKDTYYNAIREAFTDQAPVQRFFTQVRNDVEKCRSAWKKTEDSLADPHGANLLSDIEILCRLDKIIHLAHVWSRMAPYILRPRSF